MWSVQQRLTTPEQKDNRLNVCPHFCNKVLQTRFLEINYYKTYVSERDVRTNCSLRKAEDGLTMPFKCRRLAHGYLSGAETVNVKLRLRLFRPLRGALQKKRREFFGSTAAFSNMTTALLV